ncbi:MAG: hypothetical protein V4792_10750 [Pseudomonadota bacterium]
MSTVYRKTAKGIAEIETRAHRLVPRLRSALILVDGRKTDEELTQMILADPAGTLASLLADGFIEVLATLADRPPERKAASGTTGPAPSRDVASAGSAVGGASIETLRRDAVRYLTDQLGPAAETVALKIERAKSMPELQPMLAQAAQVLRSMRGAAAAEAFAARFISDSQA